MPAPVVSGYAPVNGLQMYYERHGAGRPLVLVHGGFGFTGMFAALIPGLAAGREVIAVELQGHGRTADVDRPFSFEQFGDDVAALIQHLGLAPADLLGYSLGGGAAWQAALRHPPAVRRLAVISAPAQRQGWYPEDLAGMGALTVAGLSATPLYPLYQSLAPHPEAWPRLVEKTRALLGQDYDWTAALAGLRQPVLVAAGDADGLPPEYLAALWRRVGGGRAAGFVSEFRRAQLALLPGTTHLDILSRADLLLPILTSFLDTPAA
ncbi:MAG: alpha/beta fold hydrolase [Anaerolineales bacterium]|nr:alpha/beta fold hydrolase [Anaerolineales bacterium]